jgi:hypothetical protein
LTPETQRLLEQELREATGEDTPPSRTSLPAVPRHGAALTTLGANRTLIGLTLAVMIVVGVVISLATGSWWALAAALAVHAAGTLAVAMAAVRLTTQTEHVSPGLSARLEAEGVANPDRAFTELVGGEGEAGGVLRDGENERTVAPEDDSRKSGAQQRTAWTPTSEPSDPARPEQADDATT